MASPVAHSVCAHLLRVVSGRSCSLNRPSGVKVLAWGTSPAATRSRKKLMSWAPPGVAPRLSAKS